ncbi:hypothetical protein HanRHA438_Chr05g0227431 [Helianthus annuus]|nr:hypothetical protein HanRHA438_Chr05g0227431 [Helianthus annuus]
MSQIHRQHVALLLPKKQIHCQELFLSFLTCLSSDLYLMNSVCLICQSLMSKLDYHNSFLIFLLYPRTRSFRDTLSPSSFSFSVCLSALVKASLSFLEF